MPATSHDRDAIEREIVELHAFFERWLGDTTTPDEAFARLAQAIAPTFHMVTPEGRIIGRDDLMRSLHAARGTRPGLRIEIRNVRTLGSSGETRIATYEEWQRHGDDLDRGRVSTVWFGAHADALHRLAWLHVHETWLA